VVEARLGPEQRALQNRNEYGSALLSAVLLAGLLVAFGGKVFLDSIDFAGHYALVHEITKYGGVRPGNADLSAMASYPPASHWLAAIIGWIGGSDLIAMMLVAIGAVFVAYFFIARLVENDRGAISIPVFAALFVALSPTRSQVGWETVTGFFYPQLVGDVVFFGFLYWLACERRTSIIVLATLAVSAVVMWLQPFTSIHILGAAIVFVAVSDRSRLAVLFMAIAGSIILAGHPAMQFMRAVAKNNGSLDLGLSQAGAIAVIACCIAAGLANVWRSRNNGAGFDAVVGSAALSSAGILGLQYFAMKIAGEGSAYAVKKHMFVVVTLGAINLARLIAGLLPLGTRRWSYGAPLLAALATIWIFVGRGTPARPMLDALAYGGHAVSFGFPDFKPGNTAAADATISPMANLIVSYATFEFPMNERSLGWLAGRRPENDVPYVMIRRTPQIDRNCPEKFAESAIFVIVKSECLRR
jgi:hypothetical protein